ncbi:hypothetical protein GH714_006415 [Hevea brasiliensis]|uniref:Actin-related protein 2/3 complex subunit 4 n=1 Tax=Hevea brasiliensis TaxID=3981 RepID=A0A6A6LJZ2_HEVBR|nr:hypothetical protein GH714_006415 [Hevea brasiliensis]
MEVAIISREVIKPSSPIIHHQEPYKLLLFNQLTPTTYSPLILFYTTIDANPRNITQKLIKLKKCLSETLNLYYPFSGRLVDKLYIDRFNEGVPFFVAHVSGRLSDILKYPEIQFLNRFLPYQPFTEEDMGVPQVAYQVNVFSCGGIALGCVASHKLVDGPSGAAFLHSWAAVARGTLSSEVVKPNFTEASIFFPPRNPFPEEHLSLMERLWFTEANYITRRFVFDAKAIASLRVKARGEGEIKPSRVEALSCFLWKCCMASSMAISGSPKPSILVEVVKLRKRTKPPMSNASIGDIFWWATAVADPSKQNRELHELASLVDEAIARYNHTDYMQTLQGKVGPAFRNLTVFAETRDGKHTEVVFDMHKEHSRGSFVPAGMSHFWLLVIAKMNRVKDLRIFNAIVAAASRIFPAKKLKGIINQKLNSRTSESFRSFSLRILTFGFCHIILYIQGWTSPELLLNPILICRNESEKCLIETSINSLRISLKVKQADELENILTKKFLRFLSMRAEAFQVLRRKPIQGYDISFLITNYHCEEMQKQKLIDFIVQFMEDIDKEISELKMSVNTRGRLVATEFLKQFI